MSSGSFSVDAPHICGELIHVEIKWWSHPGSYWEPPDGGEERVYTERCPKCGVDLTYDDIFDKTVDKLAESRYMDSERDNEPDFDFEDDLDAGTFSGSDLEPDGYERQEGDA